MHLSSTFFLMGKEKEGAAETPDLANVKSDLSVAGFPEREHRQFIDGNRKAKLCYSLASPKLIFSPKKRSGLNVQPKTSPLGVNYFELPVNSTLSRCLWM